MNYYLCGFVGTGVFEDTFRPAGVDTLPPDAQWSCIDLRPLDGQTKPDGFCIVATEEVLSDPGATVLGDGSEPVDKAARAAVEAALSVTLDANATTPATIVEDLLVNHGTDPSDKSTWNAVEAQGDTVEIWLGGEKLVDKPADEAGVISVEPADGVAVRAEVTP